MRRIGVLASLFSTLLVGGLLACSSNSQSPHGTQIVVFAAASLKPAFTEIGARFKTDNPGGAADFSFAGPSDLATQPTQGAPTAVFASADTAPINAVATAAVLGAS